MKFSMILLTTIFSAMAQAQIQPTSEVITQNTGVLLEGKYADMDGETADGLPTAKLLSIETTGNYDEVVVTFSDLEAGTYQYRFASLPKNLVSLSPYLQYGGCSGDAVKSSLEHLVRATTSATERLEVILSEKTKAEIRLTRELPPKVLEITPYITEGCSDPGPVAQLKWQTAKRPATAWKQLKVSSKKTVVIRYPAKLQDAKFELVKVK